METLTRPRFKPWFHAEVVPPEGVYLLSETGNVVLKGERNCLLAPFLDGRYTLDEIVDQLAGQVPAAEVYYAVDLMRKRGYVEEGEGAGTSPDRNFWQALTLRPEEALRRLDRARVSVSVVGDVDAGPTVAALEAMGLSVGEDGTFAMVVTDDYLRPDIGEINARSLAAERPWMLMKPTGVLVWAGPVFEPGRTGCWECLAQRLRLNREVDSYLQGRLDQEQPFPTSRAALPSTVNLGVHMAAVEAAKWIGRGRDKRVSGTMWTLNTLYMSTMEHTLVRRPQCPACGTVTDPELLPPPPALQARTKRFTVDGGHRSARPEEIIERYQRHVSPFIGAVRELSRLSTEEHDVMPVYAAGHNFAVRNVSLQFLRRGLRTRAAGKGTADTQAKASALAEALERYSGLFFGNESRVRASYRSLGDAAIHPNDCMLYSDRQYEERDAWNAKGLKFAVVPARFDESAAVEWSPVWSLTRGEYRFLPTGYLYYNYPLGGDFPYWADSNGNAAGSSTEDAILQGFMELVERDAVAMWWYNRVRRPQLDLDSFEDDYVDTLRAKYDELARPLWVLDVTHDFGIPSFVAVSRRVDKPAEDILVAFGAHFDPQLALRRALTEMNQFLHAVLPMKADGSGEYRFPDEESRDWWMTATIENQPYLRPADGVPARRRSDFDYHPTTDLLGDVEACRTLVEERGMEMLFLDQTRPDLGLPTVKVIVPGMRHFWARYAPGRLYDVPVRCGWTADRVAEEDLNPIPVFL